MKTILTAALMLSVFEATAEVRKWTSADGSKSFEAKFKKIQGNQVTILRNGYEKNFDLKILSEADQQWLIAIRQEQPLREWTSSDGKKTFMAEVVSVDGSSVTFLKNYSKLTVDQSTLSASDQEWLENNQGKLSKEEEQPSEDGFASRLKGKTVKLDGERLKKHDLKESKYYVLYFTASW